MNIFGSIVSLLALAAVVPLGIHKAAKAALRDAALTANMARRDLRRLFLTHAVKPTNKLLIVSMIILLIMVGWAHYILPANRASGSLLNILVNALDGVTILSLAFHLFRLIRQWRAKPKYVMARYKTEKDPRTGRRKLKLVNGLPVPATKRDLLTSVEREVRDAEGNRIVDVGSSNYNPKHFSFKLSLGIVIVSYVLVSGLLAWVAVTANSRLIVAISVLCALVATAISYVLTQFIAWGYKKGADLAETVPTAAIRAALRIIDAGITINNVREVFRTLNITEQEHYAPRIAGLVPALAKDAFLFLLIIWVHPSLLVAVVASVVMGVTAFLDWRFERRGGKLEVANRRFRLDQILSRYVPTGLVILIVCEELIHDFWGNVLRDQLIGLKIWFFEVLSGRQAFLVADPSKRWTYVGLTVLGIVVFVIFAQTLGGALKKSGASRGSRSLGTLMQLVGSAMLVVAAYNVTLLVATIGKRGGQQEIALPKGGITPAAATDLAAVVTEDGNGVKHIKLSWKVAHPDQGPDQDGFIIQRRVMNSAFERITIVPRNAWTWTDVTAEKGVAYGYRVIACNGIRQSAPTAGAWATIPNFKVVEQTAPTADAAVEETSPDATPETKKEKAPSRPKRRVEKSPERVAQEAPVRVKRKYGQAVEGWDDEFRAATGQSP